MEYESKEYRIDREVLQDLAGFTVDRKADVREILEMVKGKEVNVLVTDDKWEKVKARAIIAESTEELPGSAKLWAEDWQGWLSDKPWAIKILEVYPQS